MAGEGQETQGAPPELGADALKAIRLRARFLVGKTGYREQDREDLEQELALEVLRRLEGYDPDKGRQKTFVSHVVAMKAAGLLRHRRAQLRHRWNRPISIDMPVGSDEGEICRLSDVIAHPTGNGRDDLRRNVAHLLPALPARLRELCLRLNGQSWAQAARELGIAAEELPALRRKLRTIFENAGLAPSPTNNATATGKRGAAP
jgi:DNA-directed RNA polymerase specialized sigma24 family protein